jgi:hypothetical protein
LFEIKSKGAYLTQHTEFPISAGSSQLISLSQGVKILQAALPGVDINTGWVAPPEVKKEEVKKDETKKVEPKK